MKDVSSKPAYAWFPVVQHGALEKRKGRMRRCFRIACSDSLPNNMAQGASPATREGGTLADQRLKYTPREEPLSKPPETPLKSRCQIAHTPDC
jgi:hypothetical protein